MATAAPGTARGKVLVNLGAGRDRRPGFITVDVDPTANPEIVWDLNKTPYPFEDSSVDHVLSTQVYEHLSIHSLDFFKEMHRILRPNGYLEIVFPNMYSLRNRIRYLFGRIDESPEWSPHHVKLVPPHYTLQLLRHIGFDARFQFMRMPWLPLRYLLSGSTWILARKRP